MSTPTRYQVLRAARIAGVKPARARAFLDALMLVQDLAGAQDELVELRRGAIRAAGATSPIPSSDRRHDFIAAFAGELVLQVEAGEVIEGNGPAQAFSSPGSYTLPFGATCVWVHGPERTLADLGVQPFPQVPVDLAEFDQPTEVPAELRDVVPPVLRRAAAGEYDPEPEGGEHPELHSGLCSDGSGRCSRCLQQLSTEHLQAGTGVEPTCEFAGARPPDTVAHTRVRRGEGRVVSSWCQECSMAWLSDGHRARLLLSGVPADVLAVTTLVPARA